MQRREFLKLLAISPAALLVPSGPILPRAGLVPFFDMWLEDRGKVGKFLLGSQVQVIYKDTLWNDPLNQVMALGLKEKVGDDYLGAWTKIASDAILRDSRFPMSKIVKALRPAMCQLVEGSEILETHLWFHCTDRGYDVCSVGWPYLPEWKL